MSFVFFAILKFTVLLCVTHAYDPNLINANANIYLRFTIFKLYFTLYFFTCEFIINMTVSYYYWSNFDQY